MDLPAAKALAKRIEEELAETETTKGLCADLRADQYGPASQDFPLQRLRLALGVCDAPASVLDLVPRPPAPQVAALSEEQLMAGLRALSQIEEFIPDEAALGDEELIETEVDAQLEKLMPAGRFMSGVLADKAAKARREYEAVKLGGTSQQ